MNRVLLLGGTSESRWISQMLLARGVDVIGSVTTPSARALFAPGVREIFVGQFTEKSLGEFLKSKTVNTVLDATHPFAVEISNRAMQICHETKTPYVRYERPSLQGNFLWAPSLESVVEAWCQEHGNALVATGAKKLQPFLRLELQGRVYFRLWKTELGKAAVDQAGLAPEQIWWDEPNPTAASVRDFLTAKQIRFAVVKDSGPQGMALTLASICPTLGVRLHVLERPKLRYPLAASTPHALEGIFAERPFEKVR